MSMLDLLKNLRAPSASESKADAAPFQSTRGFFYYFLLIIIK